MTFNQPQMQNERGEQAVRRFVHSPISIDHYGIQASIKANGSITLSKVVKALENGEVEVDEIEIPASLIFKLVQLLKATRRIEYRTLTPENKDVSQS